jgi:hypothetical protein
MGSHLGLKAVLWRAAGGYPAQPLGNELLVHLRVPEHIQKHPGLGIPSVRYDKGIVIKHIPIRPVDTRKVTSIQSQHYFQTIYMAPTPNTPG